MKEMGRNVGMEWDPEVFDPNLALASLGGDQEFLIEVAGLFLAAWPTLWSDIRAGLAAGNLRAAERSASLVKAAARNISARKVSEAAHCLETLAREGALEGARAVSTSLAQEVERLKPLLSTLGNPNPL
jgi:HPt (histidine-containing phosphotransfer) domain-containing protein